MWTEGNSSPIRSGDGTNLSVVKTAGTVNYHRFLVYTSTLMAPSLSDPVKLPCGLVFPNRLAKAAMAEMMAGSSSNTPTPALLVAYRQWAQGGWGAILTGNVQVDVNHLGSPFDVAVPSEYTDREKNEALSGEWRKYAEACQTHGSPAIVQLSHPGRQSPRPAGRRGIFAQSIAPSAVPLRLGDGLFDWLISTLAFPAPREMTQADIDTVINKFVDAARLVADCGFSGIELHGAHGYLLDQFLNAKTNLRTDAYGGTPEKRAKIVLDILAEIRKVVPSTFCIGIKLNSADHSSATFEHTMAQVGLLAEAGIDFLEVSGGTYENPTMMGYGDQLAKSDRTVAREAFFLEFEAEVRKRYPNLVLILTGGFRSRAGAESAIEAGACDLVGIGRPSAVNAKFAQLLLDEAASDQEARLPLSKVKAPFIARFLPTKSIGAGLETTFYAGQIKRMGEGLPTFVPEL